VKLRSTTFVRLPDFVEPMKAKLVGSMPPGDSLHEVKFDGYRTLALRVEAVKTGHIARRKRIGQQIPPAVRPTGAIGIQLFEL
jgi:ATP-dependent DNA ligase